MKAIIIAAGKGSRLEHLTTEKPKCLVEVDGKSILQHQLDAYRANDVHDIHIVKGYLHEKIDLPDITYYVNHDFENNNILHSLMHAEDAMDDCFISSYSDIIFEPDVVRRVLESEADIALAVDKDWKTQYVDRTLHTPEEAEKVVHDENGHVIHVGKRIDAHIDDVHGEYIGLFKCSGESAPLFRDYFRKATREFSGLPFIKSADFQQAFVTDLLMYMIADGVRVSCELIDGGWHEIDTLEDVDRVRAQRESDPQ